MLYTVLFALLTPLLLLRLYGRGLRQPNGNTGWAARFGHYMLPALTTRPIWIHAVSVGESLAAVPLVRALQETQAGVPILVTTTTMTGADAVLRMLGDSVTQVYFPYDLPWVLQRFFRHFRPRLLVVMETELWPNTFAMCRSKGVPIILANARLSARSLAAYRRLPAFSAAMVRTLDHIAAQTREDAERFIALGAEPGRIAVVGSLKFDVMLPPGVPEQAAAVHRALGIKRPLVIAASTRPGEEMIVLAAWRRVQAALPAPLLILAPRHPERFDEVADLCRRQGFSCLRHSQRTDCAPTVEVFLIDGMGELPRFYAAADVAFVGGSLLPFGGHNVLEPAVLGTPVVVGPHTFNFTEIVRLLADVGALVVVEDASQLAAALLNWLGDRNERDRVGNLGRDIVHRHRGATQRTVTVIADLLAARA